MKTLLTCLVLLFLASDLSPQNRRGTEGQRTSDAGEHPRRTGAVCPMKHVVSGFWCAKDGLAFSPMDLKERIEAFVCPKCEKAQKQAGVCHSCGVTCEKGLAPANACPTCLGVTEPVKLCEIVRYACSDCGKEAAKAGDCKKCGTALEETVSRALIDYSCPACQAKASQPGSCTSEACKRNGKPLVAACAMAGQPPHVAPPTDGKNRKPSSDKDTTKKKKKKKDDGD